ncbi:MAG: hypothetical protein GY790_20025 [Bacteroidetes bacterium]|nr:hypothetical protein [Bacteroidota bacterium]
MQFRCGEIDHEEENIHTTMPKETRELANFLALVIDVSIDYESESGFKTGIRCSIKGVLERSRVNSCLTRILIFIGCAINVRMKGSSVSGKIVVGIMGDRLCTTE